VVPGLIKSVASGPLRIHFETIRQNVNLAVRTRCAWARRRSFRPGGRESLRLTSESWPCVRLMKSGRDCKKTTESQQDRSVAGQSRDFLNFQKRHPHKAKRDASHSSFRCSRTTDGRRTFFGAIADEARLSSLQARPSPPHEDAGRHLCFTHPVVTLWGPGFGPIRNGEERSISIDLSGLSDHRQRIAKNPFLRGNVWLVIGSARIAMKIFKGTPYQLPGITPRAFVRKLTGRGKQNCRISAAAPTPGDRPPLFHVGLMG